jgi:hypothetical protein
LQDDHASLEPQAEAEAPQGPAELLKARDARRTAALTQCVRELSSSGVPQELTHTLVAERVGVPVQYVRWKYPSVEHLLAMAEA